MSRATVAIGVVATLGISMVAAGLSITVWAIATDFNSTAAFGGSLLPIVAVFAMATGASLIVVAVRGHRKLRS